MIHFLNISTAKAQIAIGPEPYQKRFYSIQRFKLAENVSGTYSCHASKLVRLITLGHLTNFGEGCDPDGIAVALETFLFCGRYYDLGNTAQVPLKELSIAV